MGLIEIPSLSVIFASSTQPAQVILSSLLPFAWLDIGVMLGAGVIVFIISVLSYALARLIQSVHIGSVYVPGWGEMTNKEYSVAKKGFALIDNFKKVKSGRGIHTR